MVQIVNISEPKIDDYSITPIDDVIIIGQLNNDIIFTLPNDANIGDQYTIKDSTGSLGSFKAVISGDGYSIDNNLFVTLAQPFAACTVTFMGFSWGITWSYAGTSQGNGFGLLSERPVQGQAGRTYYALNQNVFYYDDGLSWKSIGPHVKPVKAPILEDFTWINQGQATAIDNGSGIYLQTLGINGGVTSAKALVKNVPSSNYSIKVCFQYVGMTTFGTSNGPVGLCFRESSTGKMHTYTIDFNEVGNAKISSSLYNNEMGFNKDYLEKVNDYSSSIIWFKIMEDEFNRYCEYSKDGVNYTNFYFCSKNQDMIADQVGMFVNPIFQDIKVTYVSWEEE